MSDILSQLRNDLLTQYFNKENTPLHCLSIYHCYKPQQLSHVSFSQPTMLMVINGHKEVKINERGLSINSGDLLLLPPDTTLWIGNFPGKQGKEYLGLGFRFDQEALKHFRLVYGSSLEDWDISAKWHVKSPNKVIKILKQLVEKDNSYTMDSQLLQHRQVELLLVLAQEGLIGNILLAEHPSWKQRVSQLLFTDPARSWQFSGACSHLSVSESSLRRKLQIEETSFRELLEEIRLSHGLFLLLETEQSIGQIADAAGYQSQSRFGERFKRHYGMTPSDLRRTLVA